MKAKTKSKTVKLKDGKKYSDKLIQEVKEAKEDYKTGKYFKGTADDVIKNLHDEINKIKKVQ